MALTILRRRTFLQASLSAMAAASLPRSARASRSANEKLNIGIIGTAHRAEANIDGVQGENIVAVCDIDDQLLARAKARFPKAEPYTDFRKLIERKDIDAVVVSTTDHTHAPATAMALRSGKHAYCEKPLSHSVHEARVLQKLAAESKKATQMGTQIHAEDNYRRVVELIRSGAIGPVVQAHVWVGKTWSGGERPKETPPVPSHLYWDLWLGPAPERPYHPTYLPANWRRWWDFGNGTLGDMGCHFMDLPFWALDLDAPVRVESEGPPAHPETTPEWQIVRYQFPARGDRPAVGLTWYDGGKQPKELAGLGIRPWDSGVLFVGQKGMLLADYGRNILLPEKDFRDFKRPEPTIPSSIGHYNEWIQACREGTPTTCDFRYSGKLTESVLLGTVAHRLGVPIIWDGAAGKVANNPDADRFLAREYRKGWEL